jgi:hypothetical protein
MKTLSVIKYLFVLIGGVMLIGAAFAAANTRSFLTHALRTEGKVVALQPRYSTSTSSSNSTTSSSTTSLTFAPLVRFSHAGQVIDFTASTASEGVPVDADLQGVDLNTAISVNGRNPFRII